jgi:hypothetical protein
MGFRDHSHNFLAMARARANPPRAAEAGSLVLDGFDQMAALVHSRGLDTPAGYRETLFAGVGVFDWLAAAYADATGRTLEQVFDEVDVMLREAERRMGLPD